ncbi:D-alanyl-D-alanine carboxypeptidase family protein [Ruminococcus albus]|uniref:Putative serine-type D-Ala-D-Ala carboxypeptidase n=1 Tax=Ruminococcus albus 8 TaxID=246199 RepID=E9SBE1_RUMAL|nr:D-alanyl-D-alanine carboxypeptidase family protein [Ruminococcus albus]EGC03390.1 putative serine-type D-Ala-D-Ala carboxypeptidase [Ruminococcus albus 8]MCC3350282.1 D-alanyl-D-alanine carboxypeptidase [Ruminococcus albus 8]
MRLDKIKLCAGAAVLALMLIFSISRINVSAEELPDVSAKAAIVYNGATDEVLFEKNADEQLPMASTTKIMSALIVLEQNDLDERFIVDSQAIMTEGSSMGLQKGDEVSLRDLACGMLLPSGNDAANAAAVRVAGSVDAFVELMNRRAAEMGLFDTHFVTPSGLDDYTDDHYSTARDMAKLAAEAMKDQNFRDICSLQKAKVFFGDPPYDRWLINSNKLLKISGITGIKTGFTDKARRCLVSSCMREGCELICVTLNDPDDWRDHMALFDHCFGKVEQMRIRPRNSAVKIPVADGSEIVCEIPDMVMTMMPETAQKVESRLFLPHFIYRPIKKDEKLGEVVYYLGGRIIARRGFWAIHNS